MCISVDTENEEHLFHLPLLQDRNLLQYEKRLPKSTLVCSTMHYLLTVLSQLQDAAECLSNPDGGLVGADSVIVIGGVSLSILSRDGSVVTHFDGFKVRSVCSFQSFCVLATDSLENSICRGDSIALLALVLASGVCTRVEQDEGVLFGSNSCEVTLVDSVLQSGDSNTVHVPCSLDGGRARSTIGEGQTRHGSNTSGGGDSTHGRSAVHVQGGSSTLHTRKNGWKKKSRNKSDVLKMIRDIKFRVERRTTTTKAGTMGNNRNIACYRTYPMFGAPCITIGQQGTFL